MLVNATIASLFDGRVALNQGVDDDRRQMEAALIDLPR
jgi:hypothetical protein